METETLTDRPPVETGENDKPTLLIVDDEAGPRESLRIVFKDRFHCALAASGTEGVNYARNHPVDLAILDIKMPDQSGVEVLRQLKELDPHIECVMLTGYETVETARAAVRYGAADYLNKPFDVYAIRELLDKCLARRRRALAAEESLRTLHRINEELTAELASAHHAVAAGSQSAEVVHEINNPLSIIAGYSQLLERDLANLGVLEASGGQQVQKRLDTIMREIERCKDIAKRFLQAARSAQPVPVVVDVAQLLGDVADLIRAHVANRGALVTADVENPPLRIRGYPGALLQVFINLGVNALHAMNGTGLVRFTAAPVEAAPQECAFCAEAFDPHGPLVRISCTDTGCGIAPADLAKIFQPYYTTKPDGTGLGLAVVCEVVRQHRGMITVQSQLGHGSSFSVYLPRAD